MDANEKEAKLSSSDLSKVYDFGLNLLRQSKSAKEFNGFLGNLIRKSRSLSDAQLQQLADIASKGWKKPRGAPIKDKENSEIFVEYVLSPELGYSPPITRAEAIRAIALRYKIEEDAASKRFDKAKRTRGSSLPKKNVK